MCNFILVTPSQEKLLKKKCLFRLSVNLLSFLSFVFLFSLFVYLLYLKNYFNNYFYAKYKLIRLRLIIYGRTWPLKIQKKKKKITSVLSFVHVVIRTQKFNLEYFYPIFGFKQVSFWPKLKFVSTLLWRVSLTFWVCGFLISDCHCFVIIFFLVTNIVRLDKVASAIKKHWYLNIKRVSRICVLILRSS